MCNESAQNECWIILNKLNNSFNKKIINIRRIKNQLEYKYNNENNRITTEVHKGHS